jgi:hypothetical protein
MKVANESSLSRSGALKNSQTKGVIEEFFSSKISSSIDKSNQ